MSDNKYIHTDMPPAIDYVYLGEFDGVQWFELVYGRRVEPSAASEQLNLQNVTTTTSHTSDVWAGGVK